MGSIRWGHATLGTWLALAGCEAVPDAAIPAPGAGAIPVRTVVLASSDRAPTTTVTGVLVADLTVALRAETAGVVQAVRFTDGQQVRKGDVLVELRDAAARAGLAEADAALRLAEAEVARTEALASREHASASALDVARANVALAVARRDATAEALRRTVLRAPFDGQLGTRDVAAGDTVDPSRVLTTLVDLDPLRAEVDVPERLAAWLKPGLDATVAVEAADAPLVAHVDYVGPTVDPASRTVRVRAGLDATPPGVRPGMTAEVTLALAPSSAVLRVPAEAVLTRPDGAAVWVVDAGKAALRQVTLGERLATDVVVTGGLAEGDQVVVQGIARLRPGLDVKVLDAAGTN